MKIKLIILIFLILGISAIGKSEENPSSALLRLTLVGTKRIYKPNEAVVLKVYNNSDRSVYCCKNLECEISGKWEHPVRDVDPISIGRMPIDTIKPKHVKIYKWPDRYTFANGKSARHSRMRLRFRIFYNEKKIKNYNDLNNSPMLYSEAFEFREGQFPLK